MAAIGSSFNFADLLSLVADEVPERTAVVCGNERLSFRQLCDHAERLAGHLEQTGLRSGDTFALHCTNRPEYLVGFFAACRLGLLPFNVNYRYLERELEYLYGNALAAGALVEAEWLPRVFGIRSCPPVLILTDEPAAATVRAETRIVRYASTLTAAPCARVGRGDDRLIIYTGGTTGMPKGVVWSHADMFHASLGGGGFFSAKGPITTPEQISDRVREAPPMVMFPVAPLMHGAALWAALASLFAGHTLVLQRARTFDPESVFTLCEAERVNMLVVVGDGMARPLADALHAQSGRWQLSALRYIGSGGAVFSKPVQASLKAALPALVTASSLGSTESGTLGPGTVAGTAEGLMRFAAREDIHVVCEGRRFAGTGEIGVLARSGALPIGYFGDPEATARTFIELDGRRLSLTGDAARLELDGSITVLGRGATCINTGGEKVFPEEIEQALKQHPAVFDALVVGVPDDHWGERVVAVVSLRESGKVEAAQLREHCRTLLAGYKAPRQVVFVDQVARTNTGKPDYSWAKTVAIATLQSSQ